MKIFVIVFTSLILLSTLKISFAVTDEACINQAKSNKEVTLCGNKIVPPLEKKVEQEFDRLNKKFAKNDKTRTMVRLTKNAWHNYRNVECAFEKSASEGNKKSFSLEGERTFLKCVVRTLKDMDAVLIKY